MNFKLHPSVLPREDTPVVIHYVDENNTAQFAPLSGCADIAFESVSPVRSIPRTATQKHTPGEYYCATEQDLLTYESHLESKWMTVFDFDRHVVAMSAQPFRIECFDHRGRWEHTPDLFLRYRDNTGCVVDVKNPARVNDIEVVIQSERTRVLCARIGLEYRMVSEIDRIYWMNLHWLAAFRRPYRLPEGLTNEVLRLARAPTTIRDLTDAFPDPLLARTAVMRACWFQQLVVRLDQPLLDSTPVTTRDEDS